jgi:Kef-type K+ transport system membrane component KefB/DNA-binding NarL/FixJ family response regulator
MHADVIQSISIAIITAMLFGFVAKWLRQPLILGYMIAGVVVGGTQGAGWVATEDIESISELGLILLLFMIGLEIDLKKLKKAGAPVISSGIFQFAACVGLGLLFFPLAGFKSSTDHSVLYLAVATALSSTMIVVKLLYDKFELDTLPGRITLGVLVFQDIWAILFLGVQPNLDHPAPLLLLASLAKGVGLVVVSLLVSRYVLPILFRSIAKLPELMMIGALGWCFLVSFGAAKLGLSREMGALIAGISISTFPYNLEVIAKVISLRDFFVTLFFVSLGTKIPRPDGSLIALALGGSAFLVISRIVTVFPVLRSLKLGNRASLIPAINLAQISEFSLVIGAIGVSLGHISDRTLSVLVFMLVITSVSSTYMILYNHQIYEFVNAGLRKIGVTDLGDKNEQASEGAAKPIVFLGFSHDASSLLHELLATNPEYTPQIAVVDFNPEVKHELDRRGITSIYGDISHADTLHHAKIHDATVLISTIPDSILKGTSNTRLLRQLTMLAPHSHVIVTAQRFSMARELYDAGAAFVYLPRVMSAKELREVVAAALAGEIEEHRQIASAALDSRQEVLP